MDSEQLEQAEQWFEKNWRHGPCPVCQDENWSFYPRLGEISNLNFWQRQIPLLLLGCDTCGYIVAVNAFTAGISPKPEGPLEAEGTVGFVEHPLPPPGDEGQN